MLRGRVPAEASVLTGFIDVQGKLLVWLVAAWEPDFTGYVVDYGAFPDQRSLRWKRRDPKASLEKLYPKAGPEARWHQGLTALTSLLFEREFEKTDGTHVRVSRLLVDYGYGNSADVVRPFCRDSVWSASLLPSKGEGLTASSKPFSEYKRRRGDQHGPGWLIPAKAGRSGVRQLRFDANRWKSFVHNRLSIEVGDPGALTLWGSGAKTHAMLAEHMLAERSEVESNERLGTSVTVWKELPNRDNDLFDCMVGACVAASVEGVRIEGVDEGRRRKRRRISLAALRARRGV